MQVSARPPQSSIWMNMLDEEAQKNRVVMWDTVMHHCCLNLLVAILIPLGSGCGSVGRVVAFDIRGPWFKSSHR